MPLVIRNDEKVGVAALRRHSLPEQPLSSKRVQFFILGDGTGGRMVKALRLRAPPLPPVSIDPVYKNKRYRTNKHVTYVGLRAEKYKLTAAQLKKADTIVVLACRAHTPVGVFIQRIRAAAPRSARIYAACLPCHSPGLRGRVRLVRGWQLAFPRGTPGYAKAIHVASGGGATPRVPQKMTAAARAVWIRRLMVAMPARRARAPRA
jgi:hypothetical protein